MHLNFLNWTSLLRISGLWGATSMFHPLPTFPTHPSIQQCLCHLEIGIRLGISVGNVYLRTWGQSAPWGLPP